MVMKPLRINDILYRVAGPDMSDARDCASYILDLGEPVLIDCGSGFAFHRVVQNIEDAGFDPRLIKNVILTHCHFDHIGGAHLFQSHFGARLIMHKLDAGIVRDADQRLTAAFCFKTEFQPLSIDRIISQEKESLHFGKYELVCLHTPGHTPGSISLYLDTDGTRILFAQDIGAAVLKEFDCDPAAWVKSFNSLVALDADLLCDGHCGVYGQKKNVRRYLQACIASQIKQGYINP
jgi:glyoxylase-like metal-dependent hydrolase (beta-lactamase superfamily II)